MKLQALGFGFMGLGDNGQLAREKNLESLAVVSDTCRQHIYIEHVTCCLGENVEQTEPTLFFFARLFETASHMAVPGCQCKRPGSARCLRHAAGEGRLLGKVSRQERH